MTHLYVCTTHGCPRHQDERELLITPEEYRAATGRELVCPSCGETLTHRGTEIAAKPIRWEARL